MDNNNICSHTSCLFAALGGLRNGAVYGGKVRFTHALVINILFKSGSLVERTKEILSLTYEHSMRLGCFAFIFKLISCLLRQLFSTNSKLIDLIAGSVGAYFVWSERNEVNLQIALYLLGRNIIGIANLANQESNIEGFKYFSIAVWAIVMFLFSYNPNVLQPSLASSMKFIYCDSNSYQNWKDFVPLYFLR